MQDKTVGADEAKATPNSLRSAPAPLFRKNDEGDLAIGYLENLVLEGVALLLSATVITVYASL